MDISATIKLMRVFPTILFVLIPVLLDISATYWGRYGGLTSHVLIPVLLDISATIKIIKCQTKTIIVLIPVLLDISATLS